MSDWREDALCTQVGAEFFFPDRGGSTREAKAVCRRCPVTAQCLEFALANEERFGIWGGVAERTRRKMLAAREKERIVGYPPELVAGVKRLRAAGLTNAEVGQQLHISEWTVMRVIRMDRQQREAGAA